jgi:hypothetical protein
MTIVIEDHVDLERQYLVDFVANIVIFIQIIYCMLLLLNMYIL